MGSLTVALAQTAARLGHLPANLEQHLELVGQARKQGADLVVFPELSLTGYLLQDLTPEVALRPTPEDEVFAALLKASREADLLFGFVEVDPRQRFFNSAAYLSQGELIHLHRKVYLPTYGLFDEGRFFAWGDQVRAFNTRFGRFGALICEDFWHAAPPYLLWLDGADVLLFISASPGRGLNREPTLESTRWVERINQAYASLFTAFVCSTGRVGYEDGLNFWGGATAFDPEGELIAKGPYHEPALVLAELDLDQLRRTRARLPVLRDERTALVQRELTRILSAARV